MWRVLLILNPSNPRLLNDNSLPMSFFKRIGSMFRKRYCCDMQYMRHMTHNPRIIVVAVPDASSDAYADFQSEVT